MKNNDTHFATKGIDINELPFDEVIALFHKMRAAYLEENEDVLAEMKNKYPMLFKDKELALLVKETARRAENVIKSQNPQLADLQTFNQPTNKFIEH